MNTNRFLIFYQSFNSIVKDIKKKEMAYMSEYGLRAVHMGCLVYIGNSERGMTVTELAKSCNTDKALISRTVKELMDDGFLETHSSVKTYNKRYLLTPKSEEIVNAINNDISRYIVAARGDTPAEDIDTFYRVLDIFVNNISLIANDET